MKKKYALMFGVLMLGACGSGGGKTASEETTLSGPPYHVSLERPLKKRTPIALSEVGGTITYIPLETSQASLVGRIKKTIFTDSLIFLDTYPWKVMAFDRSSGRFLRNYGNVGRGPGEFIQTMDIGLSLDRSEVYILKESAGFITYGVGGDFQNASKINAYGGSGFIPYDDSLFVFGVHNSPTLKPGMIGENTEVSVFFSDAQGRVGKSYEYHYHFEGNISLGYSLYRLGNRVQFLEVVADTLYTVTPQALIPYAAFDLGSEKVSMELFRTPVPSAADIEKHVNNYADKFEMHSVQEDLDHIYMRVAPISPDQTHNALGLFNKRTGETKLTDGNGFTNDLDGGVPFFPEYVYNDEVLVDYVDAYVLKEHVESLDVAKMTRLYGDAYKKLAALAASLDEDSNPVMILVSK